MSDHVCFDGFIGPVNNVFIICLLPRMSWRGYGIAAARMSVRAYDITAVQIWCIFA